MQAVSASDSSQFADWPCPLVMYLNPKVNPKFIYAPNSGVVISMLKGFRECRAGEMPYWSTNSWGFRGDEFNPIPPAGTFRIVCIGASTTEGLSSGPNNATYPYLLGIELNKIMPGINFEVINAGHSGYNLADIEGICRLPEKPGINLLHPDLVIFYELVNNIDFQKWTDARVGEVPNKSIARRLEEHSALYWVLSAWFDWGVIPKADHAFFQSPPDEMARFEKELRKIPRAVKEFGSKSLMMTFCTTIKPDLRMPIRHYYVYADQMEHKWHPFTREELISIFAAYNDRIRRVAEEESDYFLDLAAVYPKDESLFTDPFHFTRKGNQLIAEIVSKHIAEKALIKEMPGITKKSGIKVDE